ncbi:ABC transporter ATP-binding protein [Paenibacillus sp. FSL H7-0737]|uniref:ABC transporter ATP-binding protein n=1 Tax=Paenibacillus sp. FSL H7-0737 TaxID=1536775 RepID=UPI0005A66FEF|nr:ABC transporter ATP-binding protein [Paenibacillus sp. FSL H7-0737]
MIECVNVKKDFSTDKNVQHVLKGIDLTIEQGDFITIMGKSGSGKTSFLNCISLLTEVTEGQIIVEGRPIDTKNRKEIEQIRQDYIGLVFQNSNLIPCLSPLENLIIAIHENLSYANKKSRAMEMLERVGLTSKHSHKTPTLSGGEMQRVAIARALINNPKMILCDEPTGALDATTGKSIMDFLLEMSASYNSALVIVTHDHSIGSLGKRQYLMNEGLLNEI